MNETFDIQINTLAPALQNLSSTKTWQIRAAVGAQAIRLGLPRAMIVAAPDDFPNCFVSFWDKFFGSHVCYHLNIDTLKLIHFSDIVLPEPTRQPDDPIDVPCANDRNCNC